MFKVALLFHFHVSEPLSGKFGLAQLQAMFVKCLVEAFLWDYVQIYQTDTFLLTRDIIFYYFCHYLANSVLEV